MPDDRDDDIPIRRHTRRRRSNHLPLILGGLALAGLLVSGVVAVLVAGRLLSRGGQAAVRELDAVAVAVAGPTPEKEGETWSHTELIDHLRSKGVRDEPEPTHVGGFWGPAVNMKLPRQTDGRRSETYIQKRKTAQRRRTMPPPGTARPSRGGGS